MRIAALSLVLVMACTTGPEDVETARDELTIAAIPRGSVWKYWDRGGDLGTSWRGSFDDTAWRSGAGPLGYGESYLTTTVGYGPSSTNRYITTYFRRTFTVDDPAAVAALTGELMYDDGAVIYLNGKEITRVSMPTGAITAATLSTGHEAGNAYVTYDWTAHKSGLVAGTNVLAVEVHQAAASSSDLVLDLALSLETTSSSPPVVLQAEVEKRSSWRYFASGTPPQSDWRTQSYYTNDSWVFGYGPFGYGESYLATTVPYGPSASSKYITTYFQNTFYVTNPGAVTQLLGEVMYDDGFVVYLNGTEIARAAMPSGAITGSTLALGHEAENRYQAFDWSGKRNLLVPGGNTIAVEVHQQAASSSDLVFDLGLRLLGPEAPPPTGSEDIARGSVWAYWDKTAAPSEYTSWAGPEWNDATWATGAGPLGYGESYIRTPVSYGGNASNKTITTYFRRWFTVDAPTVKTTLKAEMLYDDGAVIYLNGYEIARLAMPSGSIGHTTLSTGHETGLYDPIDLTAYAGYLVPGPNLLAVEVHQAGATSSDLSFDLALQVNTPSVCGIPACGPAVAPPPGSALTDVWVGPSTIWVSGGEGAIGRSTGDGTWCWCDRDGGYTSVWGTADNDVWFAGGAGQLVHYDGTAFTTMATGTSTSITDIGGTAPDDVWVTGGGGMVRHYDGESWQARTVPTSAESPTPPSLFAVYAASADAVWVAGTEDAPYPGNSDYDGSSGMIYRWDPTTQQWVTEVQNTVYYGSGSFRAIDGASATNIWAVGSEHPAGAACSISGAMHYDGVTWSSVAIPWEVGECMDYETVAVGAPGAENGVWIGGRTDGDPGALRYRNGVWTREGRELADNLNAIDHAGTRLYGVGDGGWQGPHKIIRWNGTTWVQEW